MDIDSRGLNDLRYRTAPTRIAVCGSLSSLLVALFAVSATATTHTPLHSPTPTRTPTPLPVCTAPLCRTGEVFHCPSICPGGCGTICATPTPTSTGEPTATPTSIVNDPPQLYGVTSPTDVCTQAIAGQGRALYCHRLGGVYVVGADPLSSFVECERGEFEVVVPLQPNRTNRFSVCQSGGATGGTGGCVPVEIAQVFVGDCNDDGNITVDELVLMTAIALDARSAIDCAYGDADGDQAITVDEITGAVDNALEGCPGALPDLRPLSAREYCAECGGYLVTVCVANEGNADAGPFAVTVNDIPQNAQTLDGLRRDEQACIDVRYARSNLPFASATVDFDQAVVEHDEADNGVTFPQPNPTGCDVPCTQPPTTPTPTN